jgi:hypothetical protein
MSIAHKSFLKINRLAKSGVDTKTPGATLNSLKVKFVAGFPLLIFVAIFKGSTLS